MSHWGLLLRVTRNELSGRYAGSLLGIGWVLLAPMLILGIYAVVYLLIFRVRVPGLTSGQYVVYIFSGLVPYLAMAEAVTIGCGSVVSDKGVLSNTVFPIDLVPVKPVLTAQGVMVAGMAVVLLGLVLTGSLHWTIVILPVIWFLQIVWLAGINWFLSLFNVVFRDLQQLLTAILMMLLVASPFAYTPAMVPPQLRLMILLNPFAYFVIAYQKVLVLGELPTMTQWLVLILITLGMFGLGSWFFNQTKRAVIDYV